MKKSHIIAVLCSIILLLASCVPPAGSGTPSALQNTPSTPQQPVPLTAVTAESLLTAFGLQRGEVTASAAALRIKNQVPSTAIAGVIFTAKTVLAYDDKAGTFKVRVTYTKDGNSKTEEFEYTGFTHPYKSSPASPSKPVEFNLEEAVEHNLSCAKYIEKVTAAPADYLTFSFRLENGKEITVGEHEAYSLNVTVTEEGGGLKIRPAYKIKYRKHIEGAASEEPLESEAHTQAHSSFTQPDQKPYFTKQDVFKHVLKKVAGSFVHVQADKFASEFYAMAKQLESTPAGLLKDDVHTEFQTYKNLYAHTGSDKHVQIALDACIYYPKSGNSIDADDYTGTLTVQYCVTETGNIPDIHANGGTAGTYALSESEEYTGFRKIQKKNIENGHGADTIFIFALTKGEDNSVTKPIRKENWRKRTIPAHNIVSGEEGSLTVSNTILKRENNTSRKSFYLDIPSLAENGWLSEGTSQEKILIESIRVWKKGGTNGEMELHIQCGFKGTGEPLEVTVTPPPHLIND